MGDDDWDSTPFTSGFGGGFGRGRGRGRFTIPNNTPKPGGFTKPSGFDPGVEDWEQGITSGGSQDAFGAPDTETHQTGGFGRSSGGFGKPFNSGGEEWNREDSSGGFGRRGDRSRKPNGNPRPRGFGKSSGGFGNSFSSGGGEWDDGKSGQFEGEEGERQPPKSTYIPPPPPETEEEIFRSVEMGINFSKYDDIPVQCTGNNAPKSGIARFEDCQLHDLCLENIRRAKYDRPTPIQKWALPCILAGRDIMGCAQTGSGKTAAFLLPVITGMLNSGVEGSAYSEIQEPACIIVGPTRELVLQIRNEAGKFCHNTLVKPVVVYGGTSVMHQLRELGKGAHIVVGTPGRLLDFISRGKIGLSKLKYLILDEADRMLDMGFGPDIKRLLANASMPPKEDRQTLLFSATFPKEIQEMAGTILNDYLFITVGKVGGANADIEQKVVSVGQMEKRETLVSIINESGKDRILVFVETKRSADFLATYLSQSDFPATSIHGDRQQNEREEALQDFKMGRAPILIATSVAARGLDIPNVQHVVNYDMPKDIDEYVHRIGRTGRCGNIGKATSFFDPDKDGQIARPLVKTLSDAQQEVPDWLDEAAQGSYGAGGFGASGGGDFGSRDTRKGKFQSSGGGGADDFDDFGDAGTFTASGGASSAGFGFGGGDVDAEEDWD